MASFYTPQSQSLMTRVDTVELERALHNLEFEKKQQIQEFEKEKQQILILEKSTNEKQDGIKRMESDVSRIDEEIKSSHRQFRQNKELLKESQKAHSSVLNFHLEAKKKEIQQLTEKYEIENTGLQSRLDHYDTVWKSYEEIYMQQENAKELMKWQLEVLQRKEAVKEGRLQISNLQKTEDALQEEIFANESPFQSITDFVIKFAEIKVSTQAKQMETEQLLKSLSAAEKDIQTLQETQAEIIKKIEEKRKEEELERQRIEKEKGQKEKALQEGYTRKKKEDQQNSANSREGVYKFGQFLHQAPTANQAPASRLPSTTKRSAPSMPHPPTPRAPLLIPSTASHGRPPSRSFSAQGSGAASVVGQVGPTPTPESRPSSDKFFINVPSRGPAMGDKLSRRPAPMQYLGNRGGRTQLPPSKTAQVMSSPSVVLADTMYNMNIQTPTRTAAHAKPQGQVAPAASYQSPILETTREVSTEPAMGPGGDAQPNPMSSEDQLPCQGDIEMRCTSLEMMEANQQGEMQNVQDYPLTPKSSQDRDRSEGTKTPKTPGDPFDLGSFKEFGNSKSPGFSFSCRAMFGDPADQNQAEQTSNNNFQENPFFSSFFGASSKFADQPTSQSPANIFGGGGNTPSTSNTNQDGAMSMFGDSPSSTQPNQTRQEPESMGFSFNFGSESPSQTPAGGENEGGGGRPGGFCLF